MDNHLKKQAPKNQLKLSLFDLPPLVFEGIPTPVQEMTQAQLRAFIPHMLKYSTGRGKPGWGKEEMRPVWWPQEVPWQNIRSDARDENQKKNLPWSDCLRKIVLSCYLYHNRADLLPASSACNVEKDNSLELVQSDDPARQLQLLQQQHGLDLASLQTTGHENSNDGMASLGDIASSQVVSHVPYYSRKFFASQKKSLLLKFLLDLVLCISKSLFNLEDLDLIFANS